MMPTGLELNIALGSPGGLDLQNSSALILHYFWICCCLGAHSEDMVQQRGLSLGIVPSTMSGCRRPDPVSSAFSVPGEVRAEGLWQHADSFSGAASGERRLCAPMQLQGGVCIGASGGKDKIQKGLKYKLVNADTYRSHGEPLLNTTQNPDWPLPITYNVK